MQYDTLSAHFRKLEKKNFTQLLFVWNGIYWSVYVSYTIDAQKTCIFPPNKNFIFNKGKYLTFLCMVHYEVISIGTYTHTAAQ